MHRGLGGRCQSRGALAVRPAANRDAIPRAGPSHNSSQHNPHHPQYQHQLQQRRESSQLSSTSDAGGLTRSQDAALSGAEGAHSSSACHVTFWLQYQAAFGQRISVVGSTESLGGWVLRNGAELEWGEGHRWSVTVEVPAGGIVEYKYVVLQPDGIQALQWQEGNNAVLAIMAEDTRVEVFDDWFNPSASAVISAGGATETRSDRLTQWSTRLSATVGKLKNELRTTRMEAFEAQQGTKQALADVQQTQARLLSEVEANEKAAKELVAEKRRAHELRLQLHENQTLFAEVMAEAREIILASVGGDEEPLTETESEEPPAAAAGEERRRSAPWGDAAAGAREGGGGAAALQGGQVRFGAGGGRAGAYASSVDESDLEAPPAPMVTAAPPLPVKQMQEARYSNGHGARSGSSSSSGNGAAAHSQNGARRTTELSGDSAAAAGAATAAAGAASAALLQEAAGAMLPPGPPADHSGAGGSSDEGSLDVSSLDVEQLATDAEDLLTVLEQLEEDTSDSEWLTFLEPTHVEMS